MADAIAGPSGPDTLTALTFRALVARERGATAEARAVLDRALEQAGETSSRVELCPHLHWHGRTGEALQILRLHLAGTPDDDWAVERYAVALEAANESPSEAGAVVSLEQAELDRFRDRSGLYELRSALEAYVPQSRYARAAADHVQEWLSVAVTEDFDPRESEADDQLARLAVEHALVAGSASEDPDDCALAAFAAHADTPPIMATQARGWLEHARYGLWQVGNPVAAPGLWCTDILTGVERYAQFAPEQLAGLPRWSVLLGALVPIDGAWRSAGAAIQLSPLEADGAWETIQSAAEAIVHEQVHGKRSAKTERRVRRPIPFGQAEPHGAYAEFDERVEPAIARLLSMVTGVLLSRIIGELTEYRAAPPQLRNTDGDPMCLLTARVRIANPATVVDALARHPDFRLSDDDGDDLSWLGERVPAAQRDAMLAEVRAKLLAEGRDPGVVVADDDQRWVRGQIRRHGDQLTVEVNSAERLKRLLEVLTELDAEPSIVEQTRIDPAQDLAWPSRPRLARRGMAPPDVGWEKHWLDEPVPALRGSTPREAAAGAHRLHLETLLREFEYEHDLLSPERNTGPDTQWLRDQLDLPGAHQD